MILEGRAVERQAEETVDGEGTSYELTLFVSGATDLSSRAIGNARAVCDAHLGDRYHLSVVDIQERLELVPSLPILAVPALVRFRPLPVRTVVGDLALLDRVALALELPVAGDALHGAS